jgi:predicted Rossmann fold flavoprotein
LTIDATLAVHSGTGKKLIEFTNSTLLTHFGLSGPSVLDISRYYFDTRHHDSGASLKMNLLPGRTLEQVDAELTQLKVSPGRWIKEQGLPERLGDALCVHVGVEASSRPDHLRREQRRALATALTQLVIPVTGDRGFTYAEVTAGGVPLSEIHLETMESRVCPGLHIAGELCDVDGRIGGFNFQWAWASGYLAGVGAARAAAT